MFIFIVCVLSSLFYFFLSIFIARRYASAIYGVVSCRLSVCLSVFTSQCSVKTAKHIISQTRPHDIPGSLVCYC